MSKAPRTRQRRARPALPAQLRHDVHALRRALARRRQFRLALRAVWLGLTVIAAGLAVRLAGYPLAWPFFVFPAAFVSAATLIYSWSSGPSLGQLARGYDRHFRLQELLSTGLEVARRMEYDPGPHGAIAQTLVEQTILATSALRRRVARRPLIPWSELLMVLAIVLIGLGLLIPGRWSGLPAVSPLTLRSLPAPVANDPPGASQPAEVPVSNEPESPEALSPEDQAAADAVADALRDSGPGRPAADALDRGDTGAAASELRELADQVDQLSPEARRDLAEGLRDAAGELGETQPERSSRLEQQAGQLEAEPADAAEGLDDLAEMLDELGERGTEAADAGGESSSGEGGQTPGDASGEGSEGSDGEAGEAGEAGDAGGGAGQGLGGEQRGGATDPPEPGGDVVPLPPAPETGGPTTPATGPRGPTIQLDAGGTGNRAETAQSGTGANTPIESAPDPLHIPPEYRDVVENYFSPSQ